MKVLISRIITFIFVLFIAACGAQELDTSGRVTVNVVGGGSAEVTGPGIDCPGQCETDLQFTQAEASSIIATARVLDLTISTNPNQEFLSWVLTPHNSVNPTPADNCGESFDCRVLVESYCGLAPTVPIVPVCQKNYIDDVEVRPVVVEKDSVIDWSRHYGAVCVLYTSGLAQCWNHSSSPSHRGLENVTPIQFQNPTLIGNADSYACVADELGVHCFSDPVRDAITEPSVEFGLSQPEALAISNSSACQLSNQVVQCWHQKRTSNYPNLPEVPELSNPTNLRVGENSLQLCVDDDQETVCWYWNKDGLVESRSAYQQ